MNKLFTKRILNEIKMYEKELFKFPNLILRPSDDITKWYFIIYDLKETLFENGVYLGSITIPDDYPLKPPDFKILTPNGRFKTNTVICTTFSKFHMDIYSSAWNILTMTQGMISFMTENGNGIGSITSTDSEKVKLAKESLEWNKNNIIFKNQFPDYENVLIS